MDLVTLTTAWVISLAAEKVRELLQLHLKNVMLSIKAGDRFHRCSVHGYCLYISKIMHDCYCGTSRYDPFTVIQWLLTPGKQLCGYNY